MSITITAEAMTCTYSPHWAWPEAGRWVVSWLDEPVDRNTATTALHLAELHSGGLDDERMTARQRASLAETFAAELGMNSKDAADRIQHSTQQAQNLRAHDTSTATSTGEEQA